MEGVYIYIGWLLSVGLSVRLPGCPKLAVDARNGGDTAPHLLWRRAECVDVAVAARIRIVVLCLPVRLHRSTCSPLKYPGMSYLSRCWLLAVGCWLLAGGCWLLWVLLLVDGGGAVVHRDISTNIPIDTKEKKASRPQRDEVTNVKEKKVSLFLLPLGYIANLVRPIAYRKSSVS